MNKKWAIVIVVMLAISIFLNVALYLMNYAMSFEIKNYKASESILIEERTVINELIPKMSPAVTKEKLARALKAIKPDERIDVLDDQIGWRFFHFWYSEDGKIDKVTYGS